MFIFQFFRLQQTSPGMRPLRPHWEPIPGKASPILWDRLLRAHGPMRRRRRRRGVQSAPGGDYPKTGRDPFPRKRYRMPTGPSCSLFSNNRNGTFGIRRYRNPEHSRRTMHCCLHFEHKSDQWRPTFRLYMQIV